MIFKWLMQKHKELIIKKRCVLMMKVVASDGDKRRYKARLVINGLTQEEAVVYHKVLSLMVKPASIKSILS